MIVFQTLQRINTFLLGQFKIDFHYIYSKKYMQPIVFNDYQAALKEICLRYGVQKLSVFGSVLRKDFRVDSDIDFLVRFDRTNAESLFSRLMDLQTALETLFQRKIDLLPEEGVKNAYLLAEIEKNRMDRIVYSYFSFALSYS